MSWKDDKDLGPWIFGKKPNIFGYVNGPRWSNEQNAINFCAEVGLLINSSRHIPCGHWHNDLDGMSVMVRGELDIDEVGPTTNLLTSSHPWTLEGNYLLCDYVNHRFYVLERFTNYIITSFTVPQVTQAGLSSHQISGWGISPYHG